jgi:inosose dehydratase
MGKQKPGYGKIMSIRIGINPLTWSNDDMPELGAETPLSQCLSEGREAGYAGFELGNKFPRDAAVLGTILASHELCLVSGWYSARLLERSAADEIAAVQDHLQLLKALGCTVMVFAETSYCVHGQRDVPLSQRPRMSDTQWQTWAARLSEVGDTLLGEGVRLAYHHHMGTVIETEQDIDRMMDLTAPSVGLLLDTGHLSYAGGDIAAVIKKHGARIAHVHCKDIRPNVLARMLKNNSSFLDAVLAGVFTVPGDGCIDYSATYRDLIAAGYDDWLVVEAEQDPALAEPIVYARKGFQHLRGIVNAGSVQRAS